MDFNDFKFDENGFRQQLGVRRFDVKAAVTKLLEIAEHWKYIGQQHLGNIVSVSAVPEEGRIDGEVLGKQFSIRYVAFGLEGNGELEASLSIQDLATDKNIEIKRFLISKNGTFLSLDGQELISPEVPDSGYKMLIAVVRSVMTASSKS